MKSIICVLICMSLAGVSCKKDRTYHTLVKGRVLNIGSKSPIDSVLVVMKDGIASGGGWFDLSSGNTSSDKKSYTYTDKNGYFEIELKGEHFAYIGFRKNGYLYKYHEGGSYIGYKPIPEGVSNNEVFEMEAESSFYPILKSREISFNTDTIFFEILSKYRSASEIQHGDRYGESGFAWYNYGQGTFQYGYHSIGDTYQPYRITLRRQNVKTVKVDSAYIKSFTTNTDTIYY